jgi:hypothetical protein
VARFTGRVLTARELADEYDFTDVDGSRPDCWGHIAKYGISEQNSEGIEDFR